jgi:hypothetical protein
MRAIARQVGAGKCADNFVKQSGGNVKTYSEVG